MSDEYNAQAESFLAKHGLRLRATFKGDKCPPWCGEDSEGCLHGDHYRITISRKGGGRLSFDFWNSINDMQSGKEPTAYDVLACISPEVGTPDSFEDFCVEYGYDPDSRKALAVFRRCDKFPRRLRAFFTEGESAELAEIH